VSDNEPTLVDPDVFWEPIRFSPEDVETIEAELPDGTRLRPERQLEEGRRLGFDRPLPIGTRISLHGRVAWIVELPPD
jgi:hypothetical protein